MVEWSKCCCANLYSVYFSVKLWLCQNVQYQLAVLLVLPHFECARANRLPPWSGSPCALNRWCTWVQTFFEYEVWICTCSMASGLPLILKFSWEFQAPCIATIFSKLCSAFASSRRLRRLYLSMILSWCSEPTSIVTRLNAVASNSTEACCMRVQAVWALIVYMTKMFCAVGAAEKSRTGAGAWHSQQLVQFSCTAIWCLLHELFHVRWAAVLIILTALFTVGM